MNPEQHELLIRIDERVGELVKEGKDVETRVRNLERWRNVAAGLLTSLGTAFGIKTHFL